MWASSLPRAPDGVVLPDGTTQVQIEARDKIGGWSGKPVTCTLP